MHDKRRDLLWQTRIIMEVYFFVVHVESIIHESISFVNWQNRATTGHLTGHKGMYNNAILEVLRRISIEVEERNHKKWLSSLI